MAKHTKEAGKKDAHEVAQSDKKNDATEKKPRRSSRVDESPLREALRERVKKDDADDTTKSKESKAVVASTKKGESKADDKKKKGGMLNGSSLFVLAISYWGFTTGRIFYNVCYPTFAEMDHTGRKFPFYANAIDVGTPLKLRTYLIEGSQDIRLGRDKPMWEVDFKYEWDSFESKEITLPITVDKKILERNKPVNVWGLVFDKNEDVVAHAKGSVIKYINPPPIVNKYHLLSNKECPRDDEKLYGGSKTPKVARGVPKLQLRYVHDTMKYPEYYGYNSPYHSNIFVDEFWLDDSQLVKFNSTGTNKFETLLHFDLMSSARWRFQNHVTRTLERNAQMFGEDSEELLQMRDLFASTHPYLLMLTFIVSFLHIIFEFLAFKSDVTFFQNQSVEDLNKYVSIQSIMMQIVCEFLLLLYLWDQSSNFLVLVTSLATIAVDVWKVTKALKVEVGYFKGLIPYPYLVSRAKREKVDNFDSVAMKYLAAGFLPIIAAYSIYSLSFDCHKGWYSYVLATCASCVYSMGFILMTPQLFINYKYKTVQFLPWRRFIYRAINTFIDDLFSFIIRMPTMHRLSCFRDDIVFVIYLYQRHIYPVDKNRLFDEDGFEIKESGGKGDESAAGTVQDKKDK